MTDQWQREVLEDAERVGHSSSNHGKHNGQQGERDELRFIDLSKWDDEAPPPRQWAVAGRIPLRQPTLLSGEGAVGKTLIALQLSVAHVTGRDWLGALPERGPAIYLGCEDEADEIHRRLADIVKHYSVRFADLTDLHLISFAGKDAILAAAGRDGIVKPTPLFERLYRTATRIKPKLITLDTVSDIFVGNENDRTQVRQFVALLRRLAIEANAAVILCSHPSLTGVSSGSGLSGSTGWHNSVRARMYLSAAKTDKGEEPDRDLRQLDFMKNNYGPLAEKILLRWRNGVFLPEPGTGSLERVAADRKVDDLFLALLRRFAKDGRKVSDKPGTSYAPWHFSKEPAAKGVSKNALADAMRRLFAANSIRVVTEGPRSHPRSHITVVEQ